MGITIGLIALAIIGYVIYSKKMCCNKSMECHVDAKPAVMPTSSASIPAPAAPKAVAAKKAPAKKVTKAPAAKKVAAKGKATSATKGKK